MIGSAKSSTLAKNVQPIYSMNCSNTEIRNKVNLTHQKAELKEAAEQILRCDTDFLQMKEAVDRMYHIFSSITGVTINNINIDKDVMLPAGKAISTAAAAHCLLEMKRTAVFLRGINKAICNKSATAKNQPVRILYAGTGPYGTLVIPLLALCKSTKIIVDLIEINSDSLEALKKIIIALKLEEYIDEVYCTDATTFKVTKNYDIVISETMLACLKSEPQVAIMQNLIPQLTDECIFIPEEISIDASLTNPKMEMDRLMHHEHDIPKFERQHLGNVFTIGKRTMSSIQSKKSFSISTEATATFPVLKLFTTVKVFEQEVLSDNDSSITQAKKYYDFRDKTNSKVHFWYVQGEEPRIESSVSVEDLSFTIINT